MPADHEIFQRLNTAQWLWYFYNYIEDREEEFIKNRDLVEYNASFVAPEAVRKIRSSREKEIKLTDDQFSTNLKNIFGRDLKEKRNSDGKMETANPAVAIKEFKNKDKTTKTPDYKYWLESDLE